MGREGIRLQRHCIYLCRTLMHAKRASWWLHRQDPWRLAQEPTSSSTHCLRPITSAWQHQTLIRRRRNLMWQHQTLTR